MPDRRLSRHFFVEPVYTLAADIVVIARSLAQLSACLQEQGFTRELRIQFTTDERYQAFLARSVDAEVLGLRVRVACLEDVTQGKLWAYGDPQRRLSKRKKDELDLIRLAEAHPELKSAFPAELREQIDRG